MSMRVSINYFEGYTELEAELEKYESRARPSRIRLLASIGLLALQKGQPMVAHEPPATSNAPELDGGKSEGGNPAAKEDQTPRRGPGRPRKDKPSANARVLKNVFGQV